jgi:hypothetical protein
LLVDRCVIRIEDDECSGTIGVAFKDGIGCGWDCKEKSELLKRRIFSLRCAVKEEEKKEKNNGVLLTTLREYLRG